jgi:uncharacterized protein with HEPN domain
MKSDLFYLDHVIQSLLKIKEYTRDVEFRAFVGDEEKQDAIMRKIEVTGEAAKRLSQSLRTR